MAGGWTRDGGVQDQIDASVEDAVKLARSRLPDGEGSQLPVRARRTADNSHWFQSARQQR
jgi:hypothetical protein